MEIQPNGTVLLDENERKLLHSPSPTTVWRLEIAGQVSATLVRKLEIEKVLFAPSEARVSIQVRTAVVEPWLETLERLAQLRLLAEQVMAWEVDRPPTQ